MTSLMTPEAFASTTFDYLIAGGGTAGLVLANRLTEIPTVSVGVIEAGPDLIDDPKVTTPLYMFQMLGDTKYDWNMTSEPQEALDGLRVPQGRGKMLGGSSGINFMQFTFASRADLDDWELLGNTGWNYDSMAPYYKKFENFQSARPEQESAGIADFVNEEAHGYGGPINASFTPFYTPIQAAWPATLANMGLALNGDPRDGVSLGAYINPMVMTRGPSRRSFAGNSYWKPFATRPNLHTVAEAVVQNIVFSSDRSGDLVATGLNFTANNQSFIANATREVIISGGTMKSPQMLELSGIGDPELLASFGIETLIDNPNVGENLQDHPQCIVPFVPNEGELTFDDAYDEERLEFWTRQYRENGTGLLAGGVSNTAQLSWPQILGPHQANRPSELVARYHSNRSAYPDTLRPGLRAQLDLTARKLLDANEQAVQTSGAAGTGGPPAPGAENGLATIGGFVAHPFSRGYVHIQSALADDDPRFDPRYLSHPLDYEVLKDLQLFSVNVSTTPPMSTHLRGNGTVLVPPLTELNEETVKDLINVGFITGWHVVGTCAMMPREEGGVVDPRLRVYGTRNVRVVDASITPLHVRGNTVSLTYAIAEKAADIIKEDMNGTMGSSEAFLGGAEANKAVDRVLLMLVVVAVGMVFVA
ncbi:MAG: hypothetical protein LQ345_007219 [Seirophora villosa]|nr:MAG: hypothetical protein LQ345_007219 [Seirophora villosa]